MLQEVYNEPGVFLYLIFRIAPFSIILVYQLGVQKLEATSFKQKMMQIRHF